MNFYLFNPDNDLATAFGKENYTPPPAARLIREELAALPLWYADDIPTLQLPQDLPADFQETLLRLGIQGNIITRQPEGSEIRQINVWGWNRDLLKQLRNMGISDSLLPTPRQCDEIRRLSHRAFAAETGRFLRSRIDYPFPEIPVELHTPDEVKEFTRHPARRLLKAPWSGSGKGLYWNLYGYDTPLARWSNGILQKQGMLMGEPVYDKTSDWAMEFHSDGSRVKFAGYSSFLTDSKGAYRQNRLLPDYTLEQELCDKAGAEIVAAVKRELTDFFTLRVAPHYTGYFGVDMMIYRDEGGKERLHPFVEINLRMSMGMVARKVADRILAPGAAGLYRVDYDSRPGEIYRRHLLRSNQSPARIEDQRLIHGYLPLTPVYPHTRYAASIEAGEIIV